MEQKRKTGLRKGNRLAVTKPGGQTVKGKYRGRDRHGSLIIEAPTVEIDGVDVLVSDRPARLWVPDETEAVNKI